MLKDLNKRLWALLPISLAAWSTSIFYGVLPKIMQDEYIYSSQARNLPFSQHGLSNYLFSLVMNTTTLCDKSFYSCAKFLNSIMFVLGVLFVFLIAYKFLSAQWAAFAASVTAFSPLAVQVSFFMPETMYFMAMTAIFWLAITAVEKQRVSLWLATGAALGAASLVKPHAIFLLPALILFTVIILTRSYPKQRFKVLATVIAQTTVFFFAKLSIGYALAGAGGLRVFGGYGSPADNLNRLSVNLSESTTSPQVVTENSLSGVELFLSVLSSHLFVHISTVVVLGAIPVFLGIRILLRVLKSPEDAVTPLSAFYLLLLLQLLSFLLLVPFFEAYATATGENLSQRIILRYYEFLIPLILIGTLLANRFVAPNKTPRIIEALVTTFLSGFLVFAFTELFESRYSDSVTFSGTSEIPGVLVILCTTLVIGYWVWAFYPSAGVTFIGRFALPILLVSSFWSSSTYLIQTTSEDAYFGYAGREASELLGSVNGSSIIVVGDSRVAAFTTKFWIDKARIRDLIIQPSSFPILETTRLGESEYAVILGDISLQGLFEVLSAGDGYQIIRISD